MTFTSNNYELLLYPDGTNRWTINQSLHRINKPAITYCSNGKKVWCNKGRCHRIDGPAVIRPDGYEAWFLYDKLHRIDGPARTYPNGDKEYFKYGKFIYHKNNNF